MLNRDGFELGLNPVGSISERYSEGKFFTFEGGTDVEPKEIEPERVC